VLRLRSLASSAFARFHSIPTITVARRLNHSRGSQDKTLHQDNFCPIHSFMLDKKQISRTDLCFDESLESLRTMSSFSESSTSTPLISRELRRSLVSITGAATGPIRLPLGLQSKSRSRRPGGCPCRAAGAQGRHSRTELEPRPRAREHRSACDTRLRRRRRGQLRSD
jgi:hypothetical protein